MNAEITYRLAVDGKQSCRSTAQVLTGQGGDEADEVGRGMAQTAGDGDVQLDGEATRELEWAFDEAAGLKWHRSSAESGHSGPPPVVTIKRRRVSVSPRD